MAGLNYLKKMHIKGQLLILAFSTIAVMLLILLITYSLVGGIISENNKEYTRNMSSQIKQNISTNCDLFNHMMVNITFSKSVQDFLTESDPLQKFDSFKLVDNQFNNMQSMKDGIVDIVLLGTNGSYYFLNGRNEDSEKIINSISGRLSNYYTGNESIIYNNQNRSCFIVASDIFSINQDKTMGSKIGIAAIVLDAKIFGMDLNKVSKNSAVWFYLADRNNKVFSCSDNSMINRKFDALPSNGGYYSINGKKTILTVEDIPEIRGKIIIAVPQKELYSGLSRVQIYVVVIFIFSMVILSVPFMFIINNIQQPLKKFIDFMSVIKSGNLKGLKQKIHIRGYAEINIMADEFNNMLDEIDNLTHRLLESNTRLYESELQKKQSEMAFLRSQINPHFLYNTLESIKGIAVEEGVSRISEITQALGQVFRYSVKGDDMVTLSQELNIVKSYVRIQLIRFSDKFSVVYEIPEEILKYSVPKMILQPVVENAIYHGLETKKGKGLLVIGGKLTEKRDLQLWVKDDGVGISIEKLEEIRMKLSKRAERYLKESGEYASIGIVNVNNRIRLTYGEGYGIDIDSSTGQGTEVMLNIPSQEDINEQSSDCR